MNIILIDDHNIVREGLEKILSIDGDHKVIGSFNSGKAALAFVTKTQEKPALVIADLSMPEMDGLELIAAIRAVHPETKSILLTMHDELALLKKAMRAEINGYVLKKDSQDELLIALDAVKNGEMYISKDLNNALLADMRSPSPASYLTPREEEIVRLIAQDKTSKQIAGLLHISEYTVETHRKNLFRKLQITSVVGLVNYAHKQGLAGLD